MRLIERVLPNKSIGSHRLGIFVDSCRRGKKHATTFDARGDAISVHEIFQGQQNPSPGDNALLKGTGRVNIFEQGVEIDPLGTGATDQGEHLPYL